MATEDLETLGTLNYYLLEGYYRHAQGSILEATRKFGTDPVLSLYKGLSLLHEGQVQECIREVQMIKDKAQVDVAAHALLIQAHKRCRNVDKETVQGLDARLKEMRKRAGEMQIYLTAVVFWHLGNTKSAKDYVDHLLKQNESFKQAIVLKAWVELTSGREMTVKKAGRLFDAGLQQNKDPFGYIGRARCLVKAKKFSHAMESVNQIVVGFPNFVPAQAERIRVYLALMNWDQMAESAQKLLNLKTQYPEALILLTLHTITQEGQYVQAVNRLSEIIQAIDRFEPQNSLLYFRCGRLFSTIAGRNMQVLKQTKTLVERAIALDGSKVEYAIELARQLFLMGKFKESNEQYKRCMQMDESSVHALLGSLTCQLVAIDSGAPIQQESANPLQDIQDQLEFLTEIKDTANIDSELFYLKAIHGRLSGRPGEELAQILETSRQSHFKNMGNTPLSCDYFLQLNPDFLMMLINELMGLIPSQPLLSGQPASSEIKSCDMILTTLNRVAPGIHEALFSRSKILFISGDMDGAMLMLDKCLENDITFSPAHLLRAEIQMHKGNYAAVSKYLDTALSYNFEIRDHPKYHLLKAKSQKHDHNMDECIKTLKIAMSLPGVKRPLTSTQAKTGRKHVPVANGDRLSIFLELAEAHISKDENHEAAKVMQDAINAFRGTPEEVRVKISNAELSLKRGDVEQSLMMLQAIKPNQPYYVQAKQKMAHIYLHYRKDKKLYTSCYRELHEMSPSTHTAVLLGDAYIKVQQPDNAVRIYEAALRKNPRDGVLASKVGHALTTTHDFKKAITYYETAMKNGGGKWLRFELAQLLIKLGNFNKAERVLQYDDSSSSSGGGEEEAQSQESELEKIVNESRRLMLLADLYRETKRSEDQLVILNKARDVQARVLKRVQIEQPDCVEEEKAKASQICQQLANHAKIVDNNLQNAVKYLKEALIYCENDTNVMLELARIEMQVGNDDSCQQYCQQALDMTRDNSDQASMMLADVMFNKKQYKQAIYHYEQLLDNKPDHYEALARLIGLLRRGGRLNDVEHFLTAAKNKLGSGKCEMQPGYQYCEGIYNWYCGRAGEALKLLNRSRCDSEWNEKALEIMIRICLNPDQQTLGGEVFDSLREGSDRGGNSASSNSALSTAERLIKEFPSQQDPYKGSVLECLMLVASKNKANAERALTILVDICQKKRDYVPALHAMAIAYQVLKQTPRARNQLKRISKMQWTHEDAEDFEGGWLLLADLYITAGKYDMASDLLNKCLEHNKSCCKAYEYLGFIFEKEQSYKDAASHYETAWKYNNENNPVIGYKLAFNYLKAKKHVEAINISHKVLKTHPDYPRMRKEILDKARLALRT